MKASYFFSLLFTALALAPSMAHLLELPNKINLSREDYLTVQQIYRGWALLGFVVAGALLSTLALAIRVRQKICAALRRRGCFISDMAGFPINKVKANQEKIDYFFSESFHHSKHRPQFAPWFWTFLEHFSCEMSQALPPDWIEFASDKSS